ncbi:MAG: hypothetical protein M3Z22_00185 [Verrucomicrobiota bacterium]|nr:hypothetical protein [Verrucomicrobiota bacterium]
MKQKSIKTYARITLGGLLALASIGIFCTLSLLNVRAQMPTNGSISPGTTVPVQWTGTLISAGGAIMESACVDGTNCENYTLTVTGTVADWAGKKVLIALTWMESNVTEYDIYIHKSTGELITSAMEGPGLTTQTAFIDPASAGTGNFRIHIAYATTPTSATDHYHGAASVVSASGVVPTATPVPAPLDTTGKVGYENFEAPGVLTPVVVTSSGGATVEYMGRGAGEPSVGANWNSTSPSIGGMLNFQSDLETLFISIDESASLTLPKATWVNRRSPYSVAVDSDPIGFTDRQTGRVFASELTLLSPDTSKISYSDDDGVTWIFDPQAQGFASAVDHQTIGGGPFRTDLTAVPPVVPPPHPLYPNAVYYCSQDIGAAFCALSVDGGLHPLYQTPLYNLTQCGGLHGHVKVAPDGTAYVPNRACGGNTAVVVSRDNGLNWTVRPVMNGSVPTTPASDDPAVGIDANGKVYCLFSFNGTTAAVGISDDQGQTWRDIYDLSTAFGVRNVAFPAAVGGSAGRAAVAYYGSTYGTGDSSAENFRGVWHLYVSQTFDGGSHWTTTDVTPTLPMQRQGLFRGGGGPLNRNLLDFFDITIDRDGRVVVGYVNGCAGGPCSQGPVNPDGSTVVTGNTYSATATIARQSSGRRLLVANDPASLTSVPGMPFVTAVRKPNSVRLAWNEADTGNLTLTAYHILRSTTSGTEVQIGPNQPGTITSFVDTTATDPSQTYYYKVVAENGLGQSPARNEVVAPYVGDTCSGVIIHRNQPDHPESTGGTAMQPPLPQLLIDYIAVGEPPTTNQLMFKMKVGNLTTLPPNSRWRMVWDSITTPDEQYYVGMTTDNNSAPTFEYGTVATLSAVIVGVPTEHPVGPALPSSNYNADGTITIFVPKPSVGNPQPGDLLAAVNGRTFNTAGTAERSTLLIDHTFVKGNTDNSFPAATYTLAGNVACSQGAIVPVSAVSRKTHGTAGDFDIDLPLNTTPGIEDRAGGPSGNHKIVVTFAVPVTVQNVTVTPRAGGTATVSGPAIVTNSQVTVNLTNVSNAQVLMLNLIGVSGGGNSGNVTIPVGILLGDSNGDAAVNSGDSQQTRTRSGQQVDLTNYRSDVNLDGTINSGDSQIVRANSGTSIMAPEPTDSKASAK